MSEDKNLNKNDVVFEEVSQFSENVAVVSEDIDIPVEAEDDNIYTEGQIEELNDDINIVSEVYEIIDGMDVLEENDNPEEMTVESNDSSVVEEKDVEDEIDILVHDEDFLSEPESVSDIEKLASEIDDMTTINSVDTEEEKPEKILVRKEDEVRKGKTLSVKSSFLKDINDFSLLSSEGFEGIPINELVNKLKDQNESGIFPDQEMKVETGSQISDTPQAEKEQASRMTIDIPDEVAEKLPEDFEIKPVDLKAAETIAREEISFTSEEDLLHELESIELRLVSDDDEEFITKSVKPAKKSSDNESLDVSYALPGEDSLKDKEKKSIESDLSADSSLIIEEDIQDIRDRLDKIRDEQSDLSDQTGDIIDITDKIVVLEDKDDFNRFIDTIPEVKKEDMKKLLNYLDGLFEKLPEDVIRGFANSEYFNLYSSTLKDLGI